MSIDDGNSVDLSPLQDGVNDADANPTNELQTISKTGNTVTLSNGGGSFTDETNDADADPQNELQTISLNGTLVTLSNGGGSFNLPAGTTDTDDQHLTLSGTTLSIDDGNSVDLSPLQDGVNDADADPANELQTIHKSGDFIVLTNGGQVEDAVDDADADPMNEIQNLSLNGNSLEISGGNTVDLTSIASSPVWDTNGTGINYNTGKVGIGTNSPTSALHIEGDVSNEILVKSNGTGNSYLTLKTDESNLSYLQFTQADATNPVTFNDGTPVAGMGIINTGVSSEGMILATNSFKPIKFLTGATARMILDQDGNLGIGTNSPAELLHIKGTDFPKAIVEATGDDNTPFMTLKTDDGLYSEFGLELGDTSTVATYNDGTPLAGTASLLAGVDTRRLVLNASNGPIHFMSGYETKMFLNNLGQLGLGTTSPEREFHLKGGPARVMLDAFGNNNEAGVRLRRNFDILGYNYFNFELHPDQTVISFADGTSWSNAAILDAGLNTNRLAINSEGGPLQLLTSGHTRMYFDNNGKAGIGTMSPQSTLHLQGGTVEESLLRLEGPSPWMGFYDNGNLKGYVWYSNVDNRIALANKEQGDITFDIDYSTRMTLNSDGNLGIGTTSPDTKLHVAGDIKIDDSTPGLQFFDGNDWHGYMYSDLTDMIIGNIHDSDILFQTNALTRGRLGKEGLELHNLSYRLDLKNTNSTGPIIRATYTDSPTNMRVATTGLAISPMGTVDAGNYPLRVVESGVYGFNLFNGSSESDWELYVTTGGNLSLYADDSYRGAFDGTSGDYTSVSDKRLKTNIRGLESALEKVLQLEPSRYEYIANNPTQKQSIGFIAQDVQKLFPELVLESNNERSEGILSLNYAGFSVLAIKAIQEQQEIIENQQQEIDDLKARLDKIEALLNK
ncbi:MAG: tail fiber domain-containing protein [Bacteroidetes bacterium]|nr:MAG: tail fiber domain-containing protein [Bacteroidota bacterium]